MTPYIHQIKYYECDRMGITHHSNYIRIMEEARVAVLEELGYGYAKMEEDGIVSPVVSVSCEYKKTTTFMENIVVTVKALELSSLKMTFGYEMRRDGVLVFKGKSTHCFFKDGKPIVLKDYWPGLCEILEKDIQA